MVEDRQASLAALKDCQIIMAAAVPWQSERHRQHELAHYLAQHCQVFFLEPPQEGTALQRLTGGAIDAGPMRAEAEPLSPTLTVVRPAGGLAAGWSMFAARNAANRRRLAAAVREMLPPKDSSRRVLWIDESSAEPYAGLFEESLVVYDCVDEDWAFSRNPLRRRLLRRYEDLITRRAAVVFASSRPLYDSKRLLNANTHLAVNGVDYEHFAQAAGSVEASSGAPPLLGFVGATLLQRTDYPLLTSLARLRPQWQIELVGQTEWPAGLPHPENIVLRGNQPYEALPELMRRHAVCLIPYRTSGDLAYIHPKKLFEYLATGKPVVATPMPSLVPYEGPVRLGRTAEEFVAHIEAALAEQSDPARSAAAAAERQALAREHTWEAVAEGMLQVIASRLPH